MPRDTPVLASNDGQVLFARTVVKPDTACSVATSSCLNATNSVTLAHSDGTETVYVHLNAVIVSAGSAVHRGQVIGYSGDTGYSGGYYHLHFQRTIHSASNWYPNSTPIYFDEYPGQQLQAPKTYTSQNIAGTSPAGYQAAFQANTGDLYTLSSAGVATDTHYGMRAGTSPAITAVGGGYEVAFQANTGDLWTVGADNHGTWNLGMRSGTSPAITAVGGGYEVAFQANTGDLYTLSSAGVATDTHYGMRAGT
ncbi:MAG: M23 family metallopeptidase, partial [Actinomycetota bacterium]|nr:M23 family metallopeptidase [Actinomycetota bacterium]